MNKYVVRMIGVFLIECGDPCGVYELWFKATND